MSSIAPGASDTVAPDRVPIAGIVARISRMEFQESLQFVEYTAWLLNEQLVTPEDTAALCKSLSSRVQEHCANMQLHEIRCAGELVLYLERTPASLEDSS